MKIRLYLEEDSQDRHLVSALRARGVQVQTAAEASMIDDQIATAGAGQRISTNPSFPVFEVIGTGRPDEGGYRLAGCFDDLEQRVAHRPEAAEKMLRRQPVGELLALGKVARRVNEELRFGFEGSGRLGGFHPKLLSGKRNDLCGSFFTPWIPSAFLRRHEKF